MDIPSLKDFIYEMAFSKTEVYRKIRDLQEPINNHIMKLLLYSDAQNDRKHLKDINTWLAKIYRLRTKPKSKKLTEKEYFKLLFSEPVGSEKNLDYYYDTKSLLNLEYSSLPNKGLGSRAVMKRLHTAHRIIAEMLADTQGFNPIENV